MVIAEHNVLVSTVHDRMPVKILAANDFDTWTREPDVRKSVELLKPPAEDTLQTWPVSKREQL